MNADDASTDDANTDDTHTDVMSADEKREDQLTRAPTSDPGGAAFGHAPSSHPSAWAGARHPFNCLYGSSGR
jgi:hypothetical protein